MTTEDIANQADMIVSDYAYAIKGDYIEVIDLNNTDKRATIQNSQIAESTMDEVEESIVLKYYLRNKSLLEETLSA